MQVDYIRRLKSLVERVDYILAISENTRRDLIAISGTNGIPRIDPDAVVAILAGLNQSSACRSCSVDEIRVVCGRYRIDDNYFIVVGGLEPHKGFELIYKSYMRCREQISVKLVIVGSLNDPHKQSFSERFKKDGLVSDVILRGFVSREELEMLYAGAVALIFPSFYEGFGFPVLEAMASACPVITSNTSSLPEVIGDAGLLVDPHDLEVTVGHMLGLLRSESLHKSLKYKGLERAKLFTWEKVAQKTISQWLKLLNRKCYAGKIA